MQTMTLEQVIDEIETFGKPSSGGADRNVYFLGDIVVKKCANACFCGNCKSGYHCDTPNANHFEYENYKAFKPFTTTIDGWTFHVKMPEMALVGDYLIAQRIRLDHVLMSSKCDCNCTNYLEHDDDCTVYPYYWQAGAAMDAAGFYDNHSGNWLYNEETCELWIVDAGE